MFARSKALTQAGIFSHVNKPSPRHTHNLAPSLLTLAQTLLSELQPLNVQYNKSKLKAFSL